MAFYSSNELYVPKTNVGSSISNDWSKKPLEDFDSLKDQNFNEKSNAAAARSCIRLTHKLYLLEIANNVIQHTFGQKKNSSSIQLIYKSPTLCVSVWCVFTISSANSQQIFIKFRFPESTWNYPSLGWKKSGKIRIQGKKPDFCAFFRIPEKTGLLNFPDFTRNGFYTLFYDNKVLFFFWNTYF